MFYLCHNKGMQIQLKYIKNKQTSVSPHSSVGQNAGFGVVRLGSLLRILQTQSRVSMIPAFFLEALEINLLSSSFMLWPKSVPCGCGTEVPLCLLAVSWGALSAPLGHWCSSSHLPHPQCQISNAQWSPSHSLNHLSDFIFCCTSFISIQRKLSVFKGLCE